MKKYEELLKNPDNKAYLDMKPKYALVNITSDDIYEVGDSKNFNAKSFKFEWEPGDKVVVLDVKNDKIVKKVITAKPLNIKEEILMNVFDETQLNEAKKMKKLDKKSFTEKFNEFMANGGDTDLNKETKGFSDEKLISFYNNIKEKERKYPKWTPRRYQVDAIEREMKKRNLLNAKVNEAKEGSANSQLNEAKKSTEARAQLMKDMKKINKKVKDLENELGGYIKKFGDAVKEDGTGDFGPIQKAYSAQNGLGNLYVKISKFNI
jgi:hypothetical protein